MAKPQISGKFWFDVSEDKINLKESVFFDKPEFVQFVGLICHNRTYVTHQKMFHFPSILNSDALYDKYAEKINILL